VADGVIAATRADRREREGSVEGVDMGATLPCAPDGLRTGSPAAARDRETLGP
jgi:hypothetical protein